MPKIVDREAMRDSILDAAMAAFVERGVHNTTIQDIAKRAGLGKGTLYLYFDNKDALTIALVERIFRSSEQRLRDETQTTTLDAFIAGLERAMQVSEQDASVVRLFFEVFGPSFASDAFTKTVGSTFDKLGRHLAAQLRKLQALGQVSNRCDATAAGRALVAMLDGLAVHRGLFGLSTRRYRSMLDETLKLFAMGLRP